MAQGEKKAGLPTWAVVLIVVAVGVPFAMGLFSAVAIYGLRKYMRSAKSAEASVALQAWSKGMIACGEREGHLPESSAAVPAALAAIAAKKYQSVPAEWADPAFACTGFSMSDPQYFQYQWQKESASRGVLHALADLDGDGRAEVSFAVSVTCSGGRCTASAPAPAGP